ncbi:ATP-binding protein [Streptomyces sp. NPDC056105]|uniref:ATP-binding protein n=1 Tax=Streptomyces sp. NPDC056105 TaxID=3345714 RepID=UPI0035D6B37A
MERLLEIEVEATAACLLARGSPAYPNPGPWALGPQRLRLRRTAGSRRELIRDLATLRFLDDASNVLYVGPPEVSKTMQSVALGRAPVDAGHRAYFTTAAELAAKGTQAAREGHWKICARFFAGPNPLIID